MTQEKSAKPKRPRRRLGIGGKKKKPATATRKPASTDKKPKAKRGRPAYEPSPELRKVVMLAISQNVRRADLLELLEIDEKTFRKHYEREIKTGRTRYYLKLNKNLFDISNRKGQGAVQATVVLLARYDREEGWLDRPASRGGSSQPPPPPPPPPPVSTPAQAQGSAAEPSEHDNIMAGVYARMMANAKAAHVAVHGEAEESQAQENESDEKDQPAEAPDDE